MASHSQRAHDRISLWPTRNQRRHDATVAFNEEVLSKLSHLQDRLDEIDKKFIQHSYAPSTPPGLLEANSARGPADTQLLAVTERLNMLEKVYLLVDFHAIEKAAKVIAANDAVQRQPESEASPEPSNKECLQEVLAALASDLAPTELDFSAVESSPE